MYCKNCGNEINLKMKRCGKCGFINDLYIEAEKTDKSKYLKIDNKKYYERKTKRKFFKLRLTACVITVILAFVSGGCAAIRCDYIRCMRWGNDFLEQEDYDAAISCFTIAERKKETAAEPYKGHLTAVSAKDDVDADAVIDIYGNAYYKCENSSELIDYLIEITRNLSDAEALNVLKGVYNISEEQAASDEWYSRSEAAVDNMLKDIFKLFKNNTGSTEEAANAIFQFEYADILESIPKDLDDVTYIEDSADEPGTGIGVGLHYIQAQNILSIGEDIKVFDADGNEQDENFLYGFYLYCGSYQDGAMTGSGILIDLTDAI